MEAQYECFERPGQEGDDVLGILATSEKIVRGEKVIVTIDKDVNTIPGLPYNTNKPELDIHSITEQEDDYWYLFKLWLGIPLIDIQAVLVLAQGRLSSCLANPPHGKRSSISFKKHDWEAKRLKPKARWLVYLGLETMISRKNSLDFAFNINFESLTIYVDTMGH